jgi:alkyl sulfatase BDS1-like metallo-beta-lactamase superfamily hydrolase
MWEEPDDKGTGVVHGLNVVEKCMRWSRKQGGAHRAIAQAWKEFRKGGNRWVCVQACVLSSMWWETVSK